MIARNVFPKICMDAVLYDFDAAILYLYCYSSCAYFGRAFDLNYRQWVKPGRVYLGQFTILDHVSIKVEKMTSSITTAMADRSQSRPLNFPRDSIN